MYISLFDLFLMFLIHLGFSYTLKTIKVFNYEKRMFQPAFEDDKSKALRCNLNEALSTCLQYYPELKSNPPVFFIVSSADYHMATLYNSLRKRQRIYVSKSSRKMSNKALIGCLAHELAHLTTERKKLNPLYKLHVYFITAGNEERLADMDVVNRGMGKYLLSFVNWANKNYEAYNSNEGLTYKEIKRLIKKSSDHKSSI